MLIVTMDSGPNIKLDPAAKACLESPDIKLWHAKWRAVKPPEHAVSTVTLGPLRSNENDIRFAMLDRENPEFVHWYAGTVSGSLQSISV